MRAIEITQPGKPEVLQLCERPMPELKAGEVLWRHRAGDREVDLTYVEIVTDRIEISQCQESC